MPILRRSIGRPESPPAAPASPERDPEMPPSPSSLSSSPPPSPRSAGSPPPPMPPIHQPPHSSSRFGVPVYRRTSATPTTTTTPLRSPRPCAPATPSSVHSYASHASAMSSVNLSSPTMASSHPRGGGCFSPVASMGRRLEGRSSPSSKPSSSSSSYSSPSKRKRRGWEPNNAAAASAGSELSNALAGGTLVVFLLLICAIGANHRLNALRDQISATTAERDALSNEHDASMIALGKIRTEAARYRTRNGSMRAEVSDLKVDGQRLRMKREELRGRLEELEESLEGEKARIEAEGEEREKKRTQLERDAEETIGALRERMARQSERQVLDKFGPGPHRVEIEVLIPSTDDGPDATTTEYVVVETAPLDLMPHSVHLFLNQVSKGVWDNTEIHKNREHILLTRPSDAITGRDKFSSFIESGVESLGYREHSDRYPHVQYTLGYVGTNLGPHWYVNKMDNSRWHGPDAESGDEGDPCFATVVEGRDVVDRMGELPTEEGSGMLVRPVVIKRATVYVRGEKGKGGRFERWRDRREEGKHYLS